MTEKAQFESKQEGMDKRAGTAEIVLGAMIACVIIAACLTYLKLYNQEEYESNMQSAVDEQVS